MNSSSSAFLLPPDLCTSALSTLKVGVELYLYDGLPVRRTRKLSLDRAPVCRPNRADGFEVAMFCPLSPKWGKKVADRPDEGAFKRFFFDPGHDLSPLATMLVRQVW